MQTIKLKYKIALGLVIFLMAVVVGIGVANHPDLRQSLAISEPQEHLVYLPLVSNFVPVQVLQSHRAYVESGDYGSYLHVVGEVRNATTEPMRQVRVQIVALDKQGQQVCQFSGEIYLESLQPGQESCFHLFAYEPVDWDSYTVTIAGYEPSQDPSVELAVYEPSGAFEAEHGWYHLTGQVENYAGQLWDEIKAVGTLFDEEGGVLACEETYVVYHEEDLHETGVFNLYFEGQDFASPASYEVQLGGKMLGE